MESTTTVVFNAQAFISPAALFRVVDGVVSACRPVSGQECSGFGSAVSRVESVSGLTVARAAAVLGLHGYAGPLGAGVLVARVVHEQRRAEQEQQEQGGRVWSAPNGEREVILAQLDGSTGGGFTDGDSFTNGTSADGSDTGAFGRIDGTISTTGTKPMSPRDFRTSSPPG